jgi:hypothetical protein
LEEYCFLCKYKKHKVHIMQVQVPLIYEYLAFVN